MICLLFMLTSHWLSMEQHHNPWTKIQTVSLHSEPIAWVEITVPTSTVHSRTHDTPCTTPTIPSGVWSPQQFLHIYQYDEYPNSHDVASQPCRGPPNQPAFQADSVAASNSGVGFGQSTSTNYRRTFFEANPGTEGKVVVHHAVEQQVLKRHPALVTSSEIHSIENLRGIPKSMNPDIHLSQIRRAWNRFYKQNPNPTKQQLLDYAAKLDDQFGHLFEPPVR